MRNCVYADGSIVQYGAAEDCPIANGDAELIDTVDSFDTVNVTTTAPEIFAAILPALGLMFLAALFSMPRRGR